MMHGIEEKLKKKPVMLFIAISMIFEKGKLHLSCVFKNAKNAVFEFQFFVMFLITKQKLRKSPKSTFLR